jgi:glycyl-tRNA synthetase beta chain
MTDLLFEIGTEEIPAGPLARALAELPDLVRARLAEARVTHGDVAALGTPRRVTVHVRDVADRQTDVCETVTGPPRSAAYDKDGKPTRAALGFAAKNNVPVDALEVVEVAGKGAYVAARREIPGEPARAVLPRLLVDLTRAIPWKKSMRWGSLDEAFVRPVHWIVAVFGGEVVPLTMFGVTSGRETRGHRFLAPAPIAVDGTLADYLGKLRLAFVLADPAARRLAVEAELARAASEAGVTIRADADLVDEVVNLVEYPQAVVGSFDPAFLEIPAEVIVSAMRAHQRYFASEDGGRLHNRFAAIAGTVTKDPAVVAHGNERVLRARLSDARFFFDEDRKTSLAAMAARLSGVVFQAKLGTIAEKMERVATIGAVLPVDAGRLAAAARLAKADLVSKVVGEFPDLQGVMGRHYALLGGEPTDVADAILDHYLPRTAQDALPRGDLGAALGIADRIDTICGCFAVGLQPTGSADAYGLRRAALAVLNILIDRKWPTSLQVLVDAALATLSVAKPAGVGAQILEFVKTRLRGLLVDGRSLPADCVDAALDAGFVDVPDAVARTVAVAHLRERPDFEPLAVAFKRVANILKGESAAGPPEPARFAHASEKALWDKFEGVRDLVSAHVDGRRYDAALTELTGLKPAVDKFFDDVLVMDEDLAVRHNRLRLLGTINEAFRRIADFRKLSV